MKDRRSYTRIRVEIAANLIDKENNMEIPCVVENISEHGICFRVDNKFKLCFRMGAHVSFQFVDPLEKGKLSDKYVITDSCMIRYIRPEGDILHIGGYLNSSVFRKYVMDKEASLFLSISKF